MNDDEFEEHDDELDFDDTGFDEFKNDHEGTTLADLWQNNPAFKIGSVVGGLVVVIIAASLLSGKAEQSAPSVVASAPDVISRPGEEGSSPAYIEALVDENTERFEDAYSTGGSAIPTPIDTPTPVLSLAKNDENGEEDPLQRWRRIQEERLRKEREAQKSRLENNQNLAALGQNFNQVYAGPTPEQLADRQRVLQAMADGMAQQMQSILDNSSQISINSLSFTGPEYLEALKQQEKIEEAEAAAAEAAQNADNNQDTLVAAGQIAYAQIITEANSDVPGPVLAEIMSGPLRGSRVLGSFEVQKELLTLQFNSAIINEITHPIEATALDPETTLPGMATDVDHHYLKRIVLPMASAFVEGMADAIANTGQTDITIEGDTVTSDTEEADNDQQVASGIEEAGAELSSILDDMAQDTEVTVIIASGTPIGLLFTQPVIAQNASEGN